MAEKRRHAGGRPSPYDESVHVPWGRSLAKKGCTDEEIAEAFGIGVRTLYGWKGAHPEFSQALKASKGEADEAVVETLYARATGTAKRVTKRKREVLDGKGGKVTLTEVIEETPAPDTTAIIFWLKNRQPALWRDRPEAEAGAAADEAIKAAIAKAGLR